MEELLKMILEATKNRRETKPVIEMVEVRPNYFEMKKQK